MSLEQKSLNNNKLVIFKFKVKVFWATAVIVVITIIKYSVLVLRVI